MINFEGGAIPEEYRTAYVVDRVNTTGTVWLGLTVGCAQCHDHKYDPITQKEYYQLYAFFNNVPENGLDGYEGQRRPVHQGADREQQTKRRFARGRRSRSWRRSLPARTETSMRAQAAWEKTAAVQQQTIVDDAGSGGATLQGGATLEKQADKSILRRAAPTRPRRRYTIAPYAPCPTDHGRSASKPCPTTLLNGKGPGRSVNGNMVLTDVRSSRVRTARSRSRVRAGLRRLYSQKDFPVANAIDDKPAPAGRSIPRWASRTRPVFELAEPCRRRGSSPSSLRIQLAVHASHQLGRFRLFGNDSTESARGRPHSQANVARIARHPRRETHRRRSVELRDYYRTNVSRGVKALDELGAVSRRCRRRLDATSSHHDGDGGDAQAARHVHPRCAASTTSGEKVTAGVPAVCPPLPDEAAAEPPRPGQWLGPRIIR